MNRKAIINAALSLCILLSIGAKVKSDNNTDVPTISVTNLDINNETLKLSYEIRNTSKQDIWILVGFGFPKSDTTFKVKVDVDDRTLLMQTRLDFPMMYISLHNLHGRYVLLRPRQIRTESVTLAIPIRPAAPFGGGGRKQVVEQATRLAIKIGYYAGDLPKMIWEVIEKPGTIGNRSKISHHKLMNNYFTGPLEFNWVNEILKERDEEILLPHTDQNLQYEKILQTVVEDLAIPYDEKYDFDTQPESPDIPPCTRIEIEFRPSMLEYYYPYAGQQKLLSDSEQQALRSLRSVIVDGQDETHAFVNDINKMLLTKGVARQTSLAHVVCYRGDEPLTSFDVFDDNCIVTDAYDSYIHAKGLWNLRKFTPQVEPFELRVQCAANLRNLWHRLRLNYTAKKTSQQSRVDSSGKTKVLNPVPNNWCDALVQACQAIKRPHQYIIKMRNQEIIGPHICPGTGKDKKHLAKNNYAMNPNC